MAWSQETCLACTTMGIQGSPNLMFSTGITFSGNIYLSPNTLYGFYSAQSIKHFSSYTDYFNAEIVNETFFVPNTVIDGVVRWAMDKRSGATDIHFRFLDANDNIVFNDVYMDFPVNWTIGDTHYNWYGVLGKDENDQWQVMGNQPFDIMLTADLASSNIGASFLCEHTSAAANLGFWGADPKYVDNLNSVSFIYGTGAAPDYIDALFNGKYQLYDGMIGGYGTTGGGGGGQYRPSYGIAVPQLPTISAIDTGMVSLYAITAAQGQALAAYMWDNNFWNSIVKNFNSPMDNIICFQAVPMSIYAMSGSAGNIVIGNLDSGIQASKKLTTTYYEINCGTLKVDEYYRSFADYAPYVQMSISLPMCGIVNIDPDDCMGGYINVVYHVDVFSGTVVAFIKCFVNGVWTVLSQHAGNMQSQFPVTGRDYSNVYIGAINSMGALSKGNLIGAMNQSSSIKPQYQRSGGVTSVAGLMGVRIPYLIISTPKYIMAENFRDVKGYTSNLKVEIGSCSGYLQATADNSELSGISNATADELDMIRTMLADGIYI